MDLIVDKAEVENALKPIYVSPLAKLLTKENLHQLAKRNVTLEMSSIKMMDEFEYVLSSWPGPILDENGVELRRHPDIYDDAYGDDLAYRWNQRMLRFATEYPKRAPKCVLALRLALWDAYWRIKGQPIDID